MKKTSGVIDTLSGKNLRIGIVVGRFNADITSQLLEGAEKKLVEQGVFKKDIEVNWVPGCFEIPVALKWLAKNKKKKFHALIALGAVIEGETPHFDSICEGVTYGVTKVAIEQEIPVAFGILTTHNIEQAIDRIGGKHGHKGEEAALVAIEMARLRRGI